MKSVFGHRAKEGGGTLAHSGLILLRYSPQRDGVSNPKGVTSKWNKFVQTKMRLKLGTKINLSERFVRFVRLICQIYLSDLSDLVFQWFYVVSTWFPRFKKNARRTDRPTDWRTDGPTEWLIEHATKKGKDCCFSKCGEIVHANATRERNNKRTATVVKLKSAKRATLFWTISDWVSSVEMSTLNPC